MSAEATFDAARVGEIGFVRTALAADPGLVRARGSHDITLLHVAAERDDPELARILVAAGVDPEAEADWGHTAFEWAATLGSASVADFLLESGAQRLNLWTASALGMLSVVQECFDGGAVIAGKGRTPRPGADLDGWPADGPFLTGDSTSDAFYVSCRNGHDSVAAFLLERGADVNARGYFGAPAIHWAAVNGHQEVVEWLVGCGADVSIIDPHFKGSPSGWAAEGGHEELAEWLKGVGA